MPLPMRFPGPHIEALPDYVLLEIFYFYQRGPYGYLPRRWHIVVHVCRRWRYVAFAFPRRLDLYLECNTNTPVRRTLDIWPCLPIVINDTRRIKKWPVFLSDNIIAALECHDRVCAIELYLITTHPLLEQFSRVMQVPFPALTSLELGFGYPLPVPPPVPPPVLDAFLGGSAPRLQHLILRGIPVPALPKILPSCHDIVQVQLTRIPHTGYISPEAMTASLSALAKLEDLVIEFVSPASRPHRRLLPLSCVILPALTRFEFHGDSEYFEDLIARIDTPSISSIKTKFFNRLVFDNPQFLQFVGRTKVLRSFKRANLSLDESIAEFSLDSDHLNPPINPEANLHIFISCDGLDWQVSGLTQICEQFSTLLSNMEECSVGWTQKRTRPLEDEMDHTQWLDLFRPFTCVQDLKILSGLDTLIAPALSELTGGRVMEVLPVLRTLSVTESNILLEPFITARQLSNHPVILIPPLPPPPSPPQRPMLPPMTIAFPQSSLSPSWPLQHPAPQPSLPPTPEPSLYWPPTQPTLYQPAPPLYWPPPQPPLYRPAPTLDLPPPQPYWPPPQPALYRPPTLDRPTPQPTLYQSSQRAPPLTDLSTTELRAPTQPQNRRVHRYAPYFPSRFYNPTPGDPAFSHSHMLRNINAD
ncbi:hypothetical protein BGW80DRAFT_83089 [Lactifluus volemus]|nr:hypothetical protein BGW80DRAFT_83089 [Lactifluus volemus]